MEFTFTVILNTHTEQFTQSASQLESVKMLPCGLLSRSYLEEYTPSHTEKDQGKRSNVTEAIADEEEEKQEEQQEKGFVFHFSISSSFFLRISIITLKKYT